MRSIDLLSTNLMDHPIALYVDAGLQASKVRSISTLNNSDWLYSPSTSMVRLWSILMLARIPWLTKLPSRNVCCFSECIRWLELGDMWCWCPYLDLWLFHYPGGRGACSAPIPQLSNDRPKVTVGLAPQMDVCAIYIHCITILAIFRHWNDVRGWATCVSNSPFAILHSWWIGALRTQYYPGESVSDYTPSIPQCS